MNDLFLESLAAKIRIVYRLDPLQSRSLIEKYLDQKLQGIPPLERPPLLERLSHYFGESSPEPRSALLSGISGSASVDFSDLISLLLGRRVWASDLSAGELLEKSAQAFNTIFDTLNQIIGLINTTLMGKRVEFETIRQVIGSELDQESGHDSLQSYLDQIREAFLVAHRAFKEAAGKKMGEILLELDPTRLESEGGRGLKFGPLRKAELYERYKDKFAQFKSWLESGRFTEELLREFEKTCQKIYSAEGRRER
jgi:hypothetical protein